METILYADHKTTEYKLQFTAVINSTVLSYLIFSNRTVLPVLLICFCFRRTLTCDHFGPLNSLPSLHFLNTLVCLVLRHSLTLIKAESCLRNNPLLTWTEKCSLQDGTFFALQHKSGIGNVISAFQCVETRKIRNKVSQLGLCSDAFLTHASMDTKKVKYFLLAIYHFTSTL